MTAHQSSKITRRARNVPLEWGQWWGSVMSSTTTRITEKDGIQRLAYGEPIAASNRAAELYDPEAIKCSVCGQKKHYTLFDRCAGNLWRFSRGYECKLCRKTIRLLDRSPDHLPRWKRKK